MKLSIITLTYKNWRELDIAISSVSTQIVNDKYTVEYLVVDDGTPDFDYQHVSSLLARDCPYEYKIIQNKNNKGTVKSFNDAIKSANGDIIIPLSADDSFYSVDVVNSIANTFVNPEVNIVTTLRKPVVKDKDLPCLPDKKNIRLFEDQEKLKHHILTRGNFISGAATSYRKQKLEELGYFDEQYRLLEDYPFYVKALLNNVKIDFLEIISIKYGMEGVTEIGAMNPILRADFNKLYFDIISNADISTFWRRNIYYSKILTKAEKLKVKNLLLYPEQFIAYLFQKVTRKFK